MLGGILPAVLKGGAGAALRGGGRAAASGIGKAGRAAGRSVKGLGGRLGKGRDAANKLGGKSVGALGGLNLGTAANLALLAYMGYDISQAIGEDAGPGAEDLEKALLMAQLEGQFTPNMPMSDMMFRMDEDDYLQGLNTDIGYANQMAHDDFLEELTNENAALLQQISQLQGQLNMGTPMGMPPPMGGMPPGMPQGMPPGMPPGMMGGY